MKSFNELYDALVNYEGIQIYQDVLEPFIPHGIECMKSMKNLALLTQSPPDSVEEEKLWDLFALSVCNDFLLLPLHVTRQEYLQFFTMLGFTKIDPGTTFNPLIHEIVEVANWYQPEEGIELGACYWPGLRFGELIFSRCAVDVYCHPSWGITEGVADRSELYFTNRRLRRKTHDLSHGWGHNSKWSTSFSRNYLVKDYSFLNVDSQYDLAESQSADVLYDLTPLQASELLYHRCFVNEILNDDEQFPYDWHLTLKTNSQKWPITQDMIAPTKQALIALGIT